MKAKLLLLIAIASLASVGPGHAGPALLLHIDDGGTAERPAVLTRAQALELAARRFDAADVNRDGKLDQDEARAMRERHRTAPSGHPHTPPGARPLGGPGPRDETAPAKPGLL